MLFLRALAPALLVYVLDAGTESAGAATLKRFRL
jgi:hypothetical protein